MKRAHFQNRALAAGVSVTSIINAHNSHHLEQLISVPVALLTRSPWQPRSAIRRDPEFRALVDSIRQHGVLHPILVRERNNGALELLAGERRLEAAREAELVEIPARVYRGISGTTAQAIAICENLARRDLSAWEEATALNRIRSLRRISGEAVDFRSIAAVSGRASTQVFQLLTVAERVTTEVLSQATAIAGQPIPELNTMSRADLLRVAQPDSVPARATALARLVRRKAAPAEAGPPFTVRGNVESAMSVKLLQPVLKLSRSDAVTLHLILSPLMKALRLRAKTSEHEGRD